MADAIPVMAEAVPVMAEAISDADAKSFADAPVAMVYEPGSDPDAADAKHCVALEAKELDAWAHPDGIRRRYVILRDAIVRGAPLGLRDDPFAGGMEDAAALGMHDADLGRTLLHHAADMGRVDIVRALIAYADVNLCDADCNYDDAAVREFCAHRDDRGATALSLALDAGHTDCAALLCPHDDDAEGKDAK